MKYVLAVYQTSYGMELVLQETGNTEYMRISEFQEVEFKPLPTEEIVANQIVALDALIEKTKSEALETIGELEQKKQEFLAIEHKK